MPAKTTPSFEKLAVNLLVQCEVVQKFIQISENTLEVEL